jgi:hypothetical protein
VCIGARRKIASSSPIAFWVARIETGHVGQRLGDEFLCFFVEFLLGKR